MVTAIWVQLPAVPGRPIPGSYTHLRVVNEAEPARCQPTGELLGIDLIACAAEADQVDGCRTHPFTLPQPDIAAFAATRAPVTARSADSRGFSPA